MDNNKGGRGSPPLIFRISLLLVAIFNIGGSGIWKDLFNGSKPRSLYPVELLLLLFFIDPVLGLRFWNQTLEFVEDLLTTVNIYSDIFHSMSICRGSLKSI